MDKRLMDDAMIYFDDFFAYTSRSDLVIPWKCKIIPNVLLNLSPDVYKIRISKEQFFEDRPWLEKVDKHYEDFLQEDIKQKNEVRREKLIFWRTHTNEEAYRLFMLKKNS
jgi:hypothetical protein